MSREALQHAFEMTASSPRQPPPTGVPCTRQGKAPRAKATTMIFGYDYTHWLVIGSLALLTASPVIGIAAGFLMSRIRRRRAAQ